MTTNKPIDINEYITAFPDNVQKKLQQIRETIKKAAPLATEAISYGMPALKMNGILVWFAAHTKHIGFYPMASGIETFKSELAAYKTSKGAIQFPLDKPLPLGLITKIVKLRLAENLQKAKTKKLI
jgi:uncharacterized protein YdhG (YjbR/CyaY superfamily)